MCTIHFSLMNSKSYIKFNTVLRANTSTNKCCELNLLFVKYRTDLKVNKSKLQSHLIVEMPCRGKHK